MNDENADAKLAVEEMRHAFERTMQSAETLDQKASLIVGTTGVLIAIAAPLLVSNAASPSPIAVYTMGGAVFLYLTTIVATLLMIKPRAYRTPIASDWSEVKRVLLDKPEREALLDLLSGYITQEQHNHSLNLSKSRTFSIGMWLLFAASVLSIISMFASTL